MDELKLKTLCSTMLAEIVKQSGLSPLGHALRGDLAVSLGISHRDALALMQKLVDRGEIVTGPTINDYWAKPANEHRE